MTVDKPVRIDYYSPMRYIKFTMETDHEITGEIGIIPSTARDWANYIPTQPSGLAHDLLDHCTKEQGFFYQEMAALGSATFRTNFGMSRLYGVYPFSQTLAWDVVGSLRDNQDLTDAPKYKLTKSENSRLDTLLSEMRPVAVDSWDSEYAYDSEDKNFFVSDENWNLICEWIKYGYARGKRRFKDVGILWALFEAIEKEVKREWSELLEWADSGREFTLALDYDNAYVRVDGLF